MPIDLRSDTVTRPTPAMRQAMANAVVGDDVLGDDPTVAALESRVAEVLGKEAAVFMPSGTMSNQVAIRTHTEPGDEIVCEAHAHIYYYEAGAPAALAGVMCRLIEGRRGLFTPGQLEAVIRPANIHYPRTALVCIEQTHNRGGGAIWPLEQMLEVEEVAREHGLKLHMDGARLWNASAAMGIAESEYVRHIDSVSVCFSKGLGAPVGSALAGTRKFIERARRFRKMYGGGMRQAGIIAAGALYAIENNRARLKDDHDNARALAKGLDTIGAVEIDPKTVETNIVIFRVPGRPAADVVRQLASEGVWMLATGPDSIRAVTSMEVTPADIAMAVEAVRKVLGGD